ncbi:MAG: HPP family protein [Sulfuricellaceae bacterium]|jgi:CBS domain-containing membrane protein
MTRPTATRLLRTLLPHQDPHPASHREKLISAVGGFAGILLVLLVSGRVLDFHGATLVVASMGASAVLLFATPHSALSQPWSLLGGHLISAAIGVACARFLPNPFYAGALAVALSIGAMHYLRCLHPPGGATALVAVLGGEPVRALGFGFLVTPVLANVTIILLVAVAANYLFPWRRYPQWLAVPKEETGAAAEKCMIAHSDLVYALTEIDSFIDVSEEDLLQIYHLAVRHNHVLAEA